MKYEHITDDEQRDAYARRVKDLEANLFELYREKKEYEACRSVATSEVDIAEIDKLLEENKAKLKFGHARLKAVKELHASTSERADHVGVLDGVVVPAPR